MDVQHDGVSEKIPKTQDSTATDTAENNTPNDEKEDTQKEDKINVSNTDDSENDDGKRKNSVPKAQNAEAVSLLKCRIFREIWFSSQVRNMEANFVSSSFYLYLFNSFIYLFRRLKHNVFRFIRFCF